MLRPIASHAHAQAHASTSASAAAASASHPRPVTPAPAQPPASHLRYPRPALIATRTRAALHRSESAPARLQNLASRVAQVFVAQTSFLGSHRHRTEPDDQFPGTRQRSSSEELPAARAGRSARRSVSAAPEEPDEGSPVPSASDSSAPDSARLRLDTLADLLDPRAGAGLDERQAQAQAQALRAPLTRALQALSPTELKALWTQAFPGRSPEPARGQAGQTPYARQLQALHLELLAQTLFADRARLLPGEIVRIAQQAVPWIERAHEHAQAGAPAGRSPLERLGLLTRSLLRLLPPQEIRRWLARLQVIPLRESPRDRALRAHTLFILRVATQGLLRARQGLVQCDVYRTLAGRPDATWNIQERMVSFACLGISRSDAEQLRQLSMSLPLPVAEQGNRALAEALQLRQLLMRALYAQHPAPAPRQDPGLIEDLMDRASHVKEPLRSRLLLQAVEICSRTPLELLTPTHPDPPPDSSPDQRPPHPADGKTPCG